MADHKTLFKKEKVLEYDLYCLKATVNEIQLRGFDIEIVREPVKALGYTTRVLSREGDLVGLGRASCSGESRLPECIHNAKFFSTLNKQKIKYEFPKPKPDPKVATVDKDIKENPFEAIKNYTKNLLETLKREAESTPTVKPTFGKIRTYLLQIDLENSSGLAKTKTETYFYIELALKVSDGVKSAEFWPRKFRRRIGDLKVEDTLPHWIKLAKDTLGAQMASTAKTAVILNPESLCDAVVPTVGVHSIGEQKFKNQSVFNKGDAIASQDLTISDDGLLDYGLATAPFDDEGNPQRKTTLVDKGVFKNFLFDQKYALMLNEKPTGNGLKPLGGTTNPITKHQLNVIGTPTNISIAPGHSSLDGLIEEVKDGIFVEQFSWLNPDPLSSGFSSEIRNGYFIKNGELGKPVKGGMVAGKVFDLVKNVSGISNSAVIDSGSSAFTICSPFIRFENVQIAGK